VSENRELKKIIGHKKKGGSCKIKKAERKELHNFYYLLSG
jgi:hypothetical protein